MASERELRRLSLLNALLVRVLLLVTGAWLILALTGTSAAAEASRPAVSEVGCVGFTVSDLDRSADFYVRLLGFTRQPEREEVGDAFEQRVGVFAARARTARLALGTECLELSEYLAQRGRPVPADARSNDRTFQHVAIVVSDIDRAYAALRAAHVEHASSGPQRLPDWNAAAGGIHAFYFRDPDRHVLELIQFPPGKGQARWNASGPRALFQGIDHTAIVVGNTDASLAFYRDLLGMKEAGHSENWGTEQEHLNGVFGARLRITQVRAPRGPGIELLEYLTPGDGLAFPSDERASDLFHWHTIAFTPQLQGLLSAVVRRHARVVSATATATGNPPNALRVRDPDGHVLELVSR